MDYRKSTDAPVILGKKPFALKAAEIALYAPLLALGLGLVLSSMSRTKLLYSLPLQITLFLGIGTLGLILLLLIGSLLLGGVALVGMRKHGTKKIFWRGSLGMMLSLVLLGGAAFSIFRGDPAEAMKKRIAGEWTGEQQVGSVAVQIELSLRSDGRADMRMVGPSGSLSGSGSWLVVMETEAKKLILMVKFDEWQAAGLDRQLQWIVEDVRGDELMLIGRKPDGTLAHEVYRRR